MHAPDQLHLALLILASANALVVIPIGIWIGYQRTRDRLPWAKRIYIGYALWLELGCCESIIVALVPSLPPLVATDLAVLGFAGWLLGTLVLAYASFWYWPRGGWR